LGRIGVLAGSKGFVGRADGITRCAQGGRRAVEVFVPEEIYDIVAGASFMETMVKPVASYRHLLKEKSTSGPWVLVLANRARRDPWGLVEK